MTPAVLTVKQVSEALACSTSAVYRLIEGGHLRSVRIGAAGIRVSRRALDEFIDAGGAGAAA